MTMSLPGLEPHHYQHHPITHNNSLSGNNRSIEVMWVEIYTQLYITQKN